MTATFDRRLIWTLRPYQQMVLDAYSKKSMEGGGTRFHVVAPPGSGKTVIGIAMMLSVGQKGVVFSPNAAIQAQWVDRFDQATDVLDFEATEKASFGMEVSKNPSFLSLTYQSISVTNRDDGRLHRNSLELIDALINQSYKTFVFDECHHLTGFWGQVASRLIARVGDCVVLGFTATPPLDASATGLETYANLLGPIDIEIPLPAIVKQGNLAPYQDLVYFTEPNDGEIQALESGERAFHEVVEELESGDGDRYALSIWVHECLDQSRLFGGVVPFDEWLRRAPDHAIAYVRYLNQRGVQVPADVIWIDEMDAPCQLDDLVIVIGDYIRFFLRQCSGSDALIDRIIETSKSLGYAYRNGAFFPANTGLVKNLTFSKNKLLAMKTVLKAEMARDPGNLRVLILVDYERGRRDQDALTSVHVMDCLTSDRETDELDPIMLTGSSVLVDDDLFPVFSALATRFAQDNDLDFILSSVPEAGYIRVSGEGKDWNTRTYVRLITQMLESGTTRALISTRQLLGEGWDSIELNTLIDLTVISSFVSVNQIRGRTIRRNQEDPYKCANNWDIVTIQGGVHYGLYDFHRLARKHAHFYGISDDGVIEKGLGHVHPLLSHGKTSAISTHMEDINQCMVQRAGERINAFESWQIGSVYRNQDVDCLELLLSRKATPIRRTRLSADRVAWMRLQIDDHQTKLRPWVRAAFAATSILGVVSGIAFQSAMLGFVIFVGVSAFGTALLWSLKARYLARLKNQPPPFESFSATLHQFAKAVLEALQKCRLLPDSIPEEAITIHQREQDCYRIVLRGSTGEQSELFSEAVWELLGPVQNHKYIIERRELAIPFARLSRRHILGKAEIPTRVVSFHPVPTKLGRRREFALVFKEAWNRHVGAGEVFFTRRGVGKELVTQWFKKRSIELTRERKTVWE